MKFNFVTLIIIFKYNLDKFEGFDTKILEHKIVGHMTGNLGRVRTFSCFVITGNKNGLGGIALGKASDSATAIRNAKNSAGKKLFYINRYQDQTSMVSYNILNHIKYHNQG